MAISLNGFANADQINQVGTKQLFVVQYYGKVEYLVSYKTIVAFREEGGSWMGTKQYYSTTTSRQMNQFLSGHAHVRIKAELFQENLDRLGAK